MKIEIWWIGKTNEKYLKQGIDIFKNRLKHYNRFEFRTLPDVKNPNSTQLLKELEGQQFLKGITNQDFLILCDETGLEYDSVRLSGKLESWLMNSQYRRIIFIIAGAFGASEALKSRTNILLSLSKLTFSHQMVRLILLEQLYRAFTIIKNEKYHNV